MSMALLLGIGTIYYTWKPAQSFESLQTATVFGTLYWVTGLSGLLYPGAKAVDPEFVDRYGDGSPQLYVFSFLGLISLAGYWLESTRLLKIGLKKS